MMIFSMSQQPLVGQGLIIEALGSQETHHIR